MIIDQKFSRELAAALLDINAVLLRPNDPFTWSSGWNSPIYCDNRLTILYPELRGKIADKISTFISEKFPETDVITGTATAGIPHAAWVAERLNKPMAYVRSKPKSHGMTSQIEGGVKKGEHTVVLEDLISTGGSVASVVDALQFVGAEVDAVLGLFTYGFAISDEKISKRGLDVYTLTDYTTLIDVAVEKGTVQKSDLELLNQWREKPDIWPKD